jgi:hypothetical protein
VDHHAGGLVDDREVWIFIDNVERDFFGYGAEGRPFNVTGDFNFLASAEVERGLGEFAVN